MLKLAREEENRRRRFDLLHHINSCNYSRSVEQMGSGSLYGII